MRKQFLFLTCLLFVSFFISACATTPVPLNGQEQQFLSKIGNERGIKSQKVATEILYYAKKSLQRNSMEITKQAMYNKYVLKHPYETMRVEKFLFPESRTSEDDYYAEQPDTTSSYTVHTETSSDNYSSSDQSGIRWAVIIGISAYKDTRIPRLRYAAADAQAFYNWAVSQNGGHSPQQVRVLLNNQATGKNIKDSLFNWLGQALEEDVVTIFFAGHGSPQSPDHPENLFLLPYDADYSNVASTGFPMWDIKTALARFIKAKKVVVIADACHSGGVGSSFDQTRRAGRGVKVNRINSGLQDLAKTGDGICVISAADDQQYSLEGSKWGGGHGVFTYYLLKGLSGEADYTEDGKITLGELFPYLSEQVRIATKNSQSPTVAGKFDPALAIGK